MNSKASLHRYNHLSSVLAEYSDNTLSNLLKNAAPMHAGVGGRSSLLEIGDQKIFVKKIPLTDVERTAENYLSTANLFHLPLFYQYRLGSTGFGAWRELSAHLQTTEWVLSGACSQFPLLYHWRVLECDKPLAMNTVEIEELEKVVTFWQNSQSIKERLMNLHSSSAELILFLEYIPMTLHDWLAAELKGGGDQADAAIRFVENQFSQFSAIFRAHNFVHFDAHFQNILCNGNIYVSDFGLAMSSHFALAADEIAFLKQHSSYDHAVYFTSLVQALLIYLYGEGRWIDHLARFNDKEQKKPEKITPYIEATLHRYGAIAAVLHDFYIGLNESKLAPYPHEQIDKLICD